MVWADGAEAVISSLQRFEGLAFLGRAAPWIIAVLRLESTLEYRKNGIATRELTRKVSQLIEQLSIKTMTIYRQGDPRWGSLRLGNSAYSMAGWGCTTTAIAQALTIAGWNITPADVCGALSSNGGYTNDRHPFGAGLVIWAKVGEAFPQFHFQQGDQFLFQSGNIGKYSHWILFNNGVHYDPLYGRDQIPAELWNNATKWRASVDRAPEAQVGDDIAVSVYPKEFYDTVTVQVPKGEVLNIRTGAGSQFPQPSHNPPTSYAYLKNGDQFKVRGATAGERVETEAGVTSDKWYVSTKGNYLSAAYTNKPNP